MACFPSFCFPFLSVFLSRGPHRGLRVPVELHALPGQLPLLVLSSWTEHVHTSAVVRGDGPRESLAAFIEWVLVPCNAKLTVDIVDDDTSPTLDPEPSQPQLYGAELPEPTADGEPEPAAVVEPSPSGATELTITSEPEPQVFDQVREPTAQATGDTAVEIVGAMESPAHGATAEGEHTLDSGMLIDLDTEILFTQPSSVLSDWQNIPPKLPLPPPLIDLFPFSMPSLLDFVSLSAHPQLTISGVDSPLV